ncbi:invasin [Salmonella enterica subsp. enterica serovar Java]|nr:invasin [Salmonella enterica]EBU9251879.1 invasin [Salmonella enterica subsp. enterica serovar Oslo]EDS8307564.1 invasin [Salmonella enterica subsp. enterica serovar Java]EGI5335875.1 invasin [Salmonella enterica subsp. enterica serovar Caracas]EBU5257401.1 invasin [Salmonella enterica]
MVRIFMRCLVTAVFVLTAMTSRAENKPELKLLFRPGMENQFRAGEKIGIGRITYYGAHQGFRVWLEAIKSDDAPERYILTGKHNPENKVRIIIGGDSWFPDPRNGNGIIKMTREAQVTFSVMSDGRQTVPPDEYVIAVNSAYMVP